MARPISDVILERNRILIELDIPAARKMIGDSGHLSDESVLYGMHKCRIEIPAIPLHLRQESLALLKSAGYKDMFNNPLPESILV
jgi:hypothetical protein